MNLILFVLFTTLINRLLFQYLKHVIKKTIVQKFVSKLEFLAHFPKLNMVLVSTSLII